MKEIIGQIFGIIGLFIFVFSFQVKSSKKLVFIQGIGGMMFFINFLLIGAYGGALFNLTILIRGLLYTKKDNRIWRPLVVELLFTVAYLYSLSLVWGDAVQIVITTLPYISLLVMSVLMWKGNGNAIRRFQIFALSPAWIIHNIINFTPGGLITELFNVISSAVSLVRFKKTGTDK